MTQKLASGKRPVFLDLWRIRLPVAGFMSIVHRATGALLVLCIPVLIWLLDLSLSGPEGFGEAGALLGSPPMRAALFVLLWALLHHLFAGFRYLLMDLDIGVDSPRYRQTAWAVLLAAPVGALLLMGVMP